MSLSELRVLYLQPAPLFGGAERQAAEQASFLPQLGVKLTVIGGPGHALADWMAGAPLERFILSSNFPAWPDQRGLKALTLPWRYVACGLRARAEFARALREHPMDVIVASLPFTWVVGSLVARAAGVPIVWRAGGSQISRIQKGLLWIFARFCRPDLLLCNGEAVRELFHPLIGGPVTVLANGVDPALFGPSAGDPGRYRPTGAALVVGFAGRLARTKHVEDVIALAATLCRTHPEVRVLVAGEGGERDWCERLARESGAVNLRFLGFVSDMASFYAACDIIVLPSESEGCSNVLLEAMWSEKVVVSTDIPPVLELVEHEKTGIIYPLGDAAALIQAVEKLLGQPELRASLARNARLRASTLTAAVAAQGLVEILRAVARRGAEKTRPEHSGLRLQTKTLLPPAPAELANSRGRNTR
jgi:glycosyltransferase involved in cell wall biosynthesis